MWERDTGKAIREYTPIKTKFNARVQNLVGRFSKIDGFASRCESRPTGYAQD